MSTGTSAGGGRGPYSGGGAGVLSSDRRGQRGARSMAPDTECESRDVFIKKKYRKNFWGGEVRLARPKGENRRETLEAGSELWAGSSVERGKEGEISRDLLP